MGNKGNNNAQLRDYVKRSYANPIVFCGLLKSGGRRKVSKITLNPDVAIIKSLLPKIYGVTFDEINIKSRKGKIPEIRHHFVWMVRHFCPDMSLNSVGALFISGETGKHYSTIISSVKKIDDLLFSDKRLQMLHKYFITEIKLAIKFKNTPTNDVQNLQNQAS